MKNRIWVNVLILVALLALSGMQPNAPAVARELEEDGLEDYGQLPLSFIPNQGQVDEVVQYYVQSGGQSLWFTTEGVTVALSETALRLEFLDANPLVRLEGANKLGGIVNYFIGNDPTQWQTDIPTYGRITYHNLWPGIDLTYEGRPGVLKSTFSIAPGVDPAQIQLAYPNADSLVVDQEGNLVISVAGEEMRENAPLAWQEVNGRQVPVAVIYQVVGQSYGFALPEGYEPAYPLVIDPQLVYSTFLGGSGQDYGYGIATDSAGNVYVTGHTESSNFPTTPGAFDTSFSGGDSDAFVVKLNADGSTLVYATFLGGTSTDWGCGITIDSVGNAYVVGRTQSSDFPTTLGAFDTSHNGNWDAFVVKLNTSGTSLAYATFLGGNDRDFNESIVLDSVGNAYMTGHTYSSNFPTTPGAFDTSHNGEFDAFVVKLNTSGTSLAYATFLGGNTNDWSSGIAVDGVGNAYVMGYTKSSNFPTTPGAFDTSFSGGDRDSFVVKLNTSGTGLAYATFLGGGYNGADGAIAVDGAGNAYVTGSTESLDFPTTPGAFDTSHNGSSDAFVVKLNATGMALVYATFLGGIGGDKGYGVAIDGAGNTYVVGNAITSDFPTTPGAFDTSHNGSSDAFVVKLNAAGTSLAYGTFLGGSSGDSGHAIAMDGAGNAYVTGDTESTDFPSTGGFDTSHNGFNDAFVAKLAIGGAFLDLPVSYSNFSQSAQGNEDGRGPGRVNSWFDHTYPTYTNPPNAGTNNITKWDGDPIPIDPNMSEEEFKGGIGVWWYDGHNGVDFALADWNNPDEQVYAAAPGTVIQAVTSDFGYGNHIWIDHGSGYATLYGHLKTILVTQGTVINDPQTTPIGIMGNTGNSTGIHLHFGIYYDQNGNGQWTEEEVVDPYGWDEVGAGVPDPWSPASVYLWKYLLQEKKGVDSAGATLTSPAGNKQAVIPAGSLSSLVTVELWDAPVASPSAQLRSLGQSFWFRVLEWLNGGGGLSASSEVAAADFTLPVTLSVTYGVTETRHLDTSQIAIYQWDEATEAWGALPTTVGSGEATAQTTQVGEFDLQAPLLCPSDQSEPDDSYYVASVLSTDGITVTRLFDIVDDEDWFKFTAVAGKTYEIATSNLAAGVDTIVEVYDIDGVTLLASDDNSGGGAASALEWEASMSGTYFLRVTQATGSSYGCDATYTLTVAEKEQGGIYLPIILKNHP